MKIFTKSEAVARFGNEEQTLHFSKYGKFKSKSVEDAVIKTMLEIFESVETISNPHGRGKVYKVGEELEIKRQREDGRKNNGAKIPYEYEINSLVLDFILKNNPKPMSPNQWLVMTGLVERRLTISYYNNNVKLDCLEELQEKYDDVVAKDIIMLEHFIKTELSTLKDNFKSVLTKLARAKIIIHTVKWYGNTGSSHRPLTDDEVISVGNLRREVATKYDVSIKDTWRQNDERVQAYWKEYNKRLRKELGLEYVYEAHGAVVQVADKDIKKYLDNLIEKDELIFCYGLNEVNIAMMISDFKILYGKHSIKKAKNREGNTDNVSEHDWIKQNKILGEYVPMWEKFLDFYELSS